MDPKLKAAWVKALRSGNYKQGQNKLYANEPGANRASYCCLGVLCRVIERSEDPEHEKLQKLVDAWRDQSTVHEVSEKLCAGFGLARRLKADVAETVEARLIWINDANGASFRKIADWVEEHL
jgi:hypothetical protein